MPYLVIAHRSVPDTRDLTVAFFFHCISNSGRFINNCYERIRSKRHLSFSCALTLGGDLVTEETLVAALGQFFFIHQNSLLVLVYHPLN